MQSTVNTTSTQPVTQPSLKISPMATAQVMEVPFETELEAVNEALENDGGDGIDHSHRPQVTPGSATPSFNLSSPLPSSTSHELDTKFLSRDSRSRNRSTLPNGFEYTA